MKKLLSFWVVFFTFFILNFEQASATVILELIGPTEYYVEQTFPYSSTQPFPMSEDPVTIWALMTNTGTETFEAIWSGGGAGKTDDSIYLFGGFGGTTPGLSLGEVNSPIVETASHFLGISLEPGESFLYDLTQWYGFTQSSVYNSALGYWEDAYETVPIGTSMTIKYEYINMLSGLDGDPSQEPSDVIIYLDKSYTVTVVSSNPVPEPATIILFGLGTLCFAGVNRKKN